LASFKHGYGAFALTAMGVWRFRIFLSMDIIDIRLRWKRRQILISTLRNTYQIHRNYFFTNSDEDEDILLLIGCWKGAGRPVLDFLPERKTSPAPK
jgi:hypothetical protein